MVFINPNIIVYKFSNSLHSLNHHFILLIFDYHHVQHLHCYYLYIDLYLLTVIEITIVLMLIVILHPPPLAVNGSSIVNQVATAFRMSSTSNLIIDNSAITPLVVFAIMPNSATTNTVC